MIQFSFYLIELVDVRGKIGTNVSWKLKFSLGRHTSFPVFASYSNLSRKERMRFEGLQVFFIMMYFKSLQQKEITIHHKNNIKTALNYKNMKSKMCAVTKGA